MVILRSAGDSESALAAAHWAHASLAAVPVFLLFFALIYPSNTYKLSLRATSYILLPFYLALFLIFNPNILITGVTITPGSETSLTYNIYALVAYVAYVWALFVGAFAVLVKRYLHADSDLRSQLLYIGIGSLAPILFALFSSLYLPFFGEFRWNWIGPVSFSIAAGVLAYGIFKRHTFDVRTFGKEMLVLFLLLVAFIRIVFSNSPISLVFNILAFTALTVVGYWFMQTVMHDLDSRTELKKAERKLRRTRSQLREHTQEATE